MKKLVLSIVLVVLLAAAVFGGQAMASNKPADISISEETSSILGSSYWGYPLRMKTLSGTDSMKEILLEVILDESYSGVRHVSLTLSAHGLDFLNDYIGINLETGNGPDIIGHITADGVYTYEFDTDNWKLEAGDFGAFPLDVSYWATITYPSNQW
jgi:opacity protein-like surface antigen